MISSSDCEDHLNKDKIVVKKIKTGSFKIIIQKSFLARDMNKSISRERLLVYPNFIKSFVIHTDTTWGRN